jgi:hypothetical protein
VACDLAVGQAARDENQHFAFAWRQSSEQGGWCQRVARGRARRTQAARALDRLLTVGRLADDIELVVGLQEQAEGGAYQVLVVDDQQADAHPLGAAGLAVIGPADRT